MASKKSTDAAAALRDETGTQPAAESPSGQPAPAVPVEQKFLVSLPNTCGPGTIRPALPVVIDMSLPTGSAEVFELIDKEDHRQGCRLKTSVPANAFAAGVIAQEAAVRAFNRFYSIHKVHEHRHEVRMVGATIALEEPSEVRAADPAPANVA